MVAFVKNSSPAKQLQNTICEAHIAQILEEVHICPPADTETYHQVIAFGISPQLGHLTHKARSSYFSPSQLHSL